MSGEGYQGSGLLGGEGTPQGREMTLITAFAQIQCDGVLRRRARRQRAHELAPLQRWGEATGRNPPDPIARRQGLGKGVAVQYQSLAVECLDGFGALPAEKQLSVDIVLDERDVMFVEQRRQLALGVL